MSDAASNYAESDLLVSHLSGYRYRVTSIDGENRRLKFATVEDLEDESGWEKFEDIASAFRHTPRHHRRPHDQRKHTRALSHRTRDHLEDQVSADDTSCPVSPDTGQDTDVAKAAAFHQDLVDILRDHPTAFLETDARFLATCVVEHFCRSGWRRPVVESDDALGAWYLRVLDEPVHHTTEGVPVHVDWTSDGRLIGVELLSAGTPTEDGDA